MKSIAFIFKKIPHGNSMSREGLDIVLSITCAIKNISLFFIGDGVFQLIKHQKPNHILSKNYCSAFKILSLYDIKNFFVCLNSLKIRGISTCKKNFFLNVNILNNKDLLNKLNNYNNIITF
ncbi:sulfurtransferase complex subunit TusC [Buchnera aphidicola (Taiwanaphis decaspermi)]|uniref:sulfurtransferase complex subunit TusC n=1 Tax=Buchnera aphidicola TaxID=9 RepID=UPI0031B82C61